MRGVKRGDRDANDLVVEIYASPTRYSAILLLKGIDRWTPGDVLLEGDPGVNLRQAWRGLMLALNRAVKGLPKWELCLVIGRFCWKLMSFDVLLSRDLFGPAWRGSEVKFIPMLQSKFNPPYLDRNNGDLYRLARHFGSNWREVFSPVQIDHCPFLSFVKIGTQMCGTIHCLVALCVSYIRLVRLVLDYLRPGVQLSVVWKKLNV